VLAELERRPVPDPKCASATMPTVRSNPPPGLTSSAKCASRRMFQSDYSLALGVAFLAPLYRFIGVGPHIAQRMNLDN